MQYFPSRFSFLLAPRPGEGLQGKTRVPGGAKAQAAKMKAKKEAEATEREQHERQIMNRLAGIAEKALDKIG